MGGRDSEVDALSQVASVTEYDPLTDTWMPRPSLPEARMALAAAGVGSVVYAIGGVADGQWSDRVAEYDTGLSALSVGAAGRTLAGWAEIRREARGWTR